MVHHLGYNGLNSSLSNWIVDKKYLCLQHTWKWVLSASHAESHLFHCSSGPLAILVTDIFREIIWINLHQYILNHKINRKLVYTDILTFVLIAIRDTLKVTQRWQKYKLCTVIYSSPKEEGWAELGTSPLSSLGCAATGVSQMEWALINGPYCNISLRPSGIMSALS